MKVSAAIAKLQQIQERFGDISIVGDGAAHEVQGVGKIMVLDESGYEVEMGEENLVLPGTTLTVFIE